MTVQNITCICTRTAAGRTYHAGKTVRRSNTLADTITHDPISFALCGTQIGASNPYQLALPFLMAKEIGERRCARCLEILLQDAADAACGVTA